MEVQPGSDRLKLSMGITMRACAVRFQRSQRPFSIACVLISSGVSLSARQAGRGANWVSQSGAPLQGGE